MAGKKPLSLYLHFPFCPRKCRYCDFLSFPADAAARRAYTDRLCEEIRLRGPEFADFEVQTVFFGGGTPSLMEEAQLACVLSALRGSFDLAGETEISLECNPGTADAAKLRSYHAMGVNRLSIGLQSANERELALLGRIHSRTQFDKCMQAAREAGFDNINVDLMSAIPGQTCDTLREGLFAVLEFQPEHISVYSLIIEEGTPFWEIYGGDGSMGAADNMPPLPDEEEERAMARLAEEMLDAAGYRRYEISNYARPGYECRHNLIYWRRGEYLGLGLGAASLVGETRFRNTTDLKKYLEHSFVREEEERLTRQARMEETMFLGLRCTDGISIRDFAETFCRSIFSVYGEVIRFYTGTGLLEQEGDRLRLTRRGIDVSNRILSDFLL